MLFAPFFGSAVIPPRVKAILVLAIPVVLYPVTASLVSAVNMVRWPILIATELAIGIALGVAANLVFDAAQMAGQILSIQMGYSLINILDPQTDVDTTVVALFHQTIAMAIFLRLDVHHWLLRAIANSYDYLPPGSIVLNGRFVMALLGIGARVFEVGLQIAAPVFSATLLADVVLGLLGKSAPQMPLMLLGPALKSVLGLTILAAALVYWPDLFQQWFQKSIVYSDRILHLAR
jgi:flagellar biosynthetic protein FliR